MNESSAAGVAPPAMRGLACLSAAGALAITAGATAIDLAAMTERS